MTNAILVMGAESSGNRLMLRILHAAGCAGKLHEDNSQDFDTHLPPANGTPIAWLRTFPHAQEYPDMDAWVSQVRGAGYTPKSIVMLRDTYPMIRSQKAVGHVSDLDGGFMRSYTGLHLIFDGLACNDVPFVNITYLGLVNYTRQMLVWLLPLLDDNLSVPANIEEIYDADQKWWNAHEYNFDFSNYAFGNLKRVPSGWKIGGLRE